LTSVNPNLAIECEFAADKVDAIDGPASNTVIGAAVAAVLYLVTNPVILSHSSSAA